MAAGMEKTRHPGIYKRGGRYVVVWTHKGRQHKSFHRTLTEAREAQGDRRQLGGRTPTSRASFAEYARDWLDNYGGRTSRGIGELTMRDYRRSIEGDAIRYFRMYRLAEVEPPDVRRFVADLEGRGLSPGSIRKKVAPLRALFATAFEDGAIRSNPTIGVRVRGQRGEHEDEGRVKALTREELGRFLAAVPAEWRPFFELLVHSGLRVSEAVGLTWRDVEFGERPRLRVRQQVCRGERRRLKSRDSRRDVPLSPGMARRLWQRRSESEYRRDADPVFATGIGTPLMDGNVRSRVLKPAAEAAGLPWVGFHTLRHTCASLLFEGGKDVKQVAGWLGHADAGFTLRTYVHLMDDGVGEADFLDEVVTVGECHSATASGVENMPKAV